MEPSEFMHDNTSDRCQPANARPLSSTPNHKPFTIPPISPCLDGPKCNKDYHARFWKSLRCRWTCFSLTRAKPEKSRRNYNSPSVKNVQSATSSPAHGSCYSAMNYEDRDEHLKAAISYCKNSRETQMKNFAGVKSSFSDHMDFY